MSEGESATEGPPPGLLEKALGVFTEVKGGEGLSALLLTLNILLLLMSYYILKPVRDALITAMPNGPEYKSYMGGAIAIALLFAVPLYARFARKLPRGRLVSVIPLFFASNIVLFSLATQVPGSDNWLPLVFYLWVGIFNMMVVAQFWSFANDIYSEEQGKRLFALIGIGASAGASIGGLVAKILPARPEKAADGTTHMAGYLSTGQLLLLSAGLLSLCAVIGYFVDKRESIKITPNNLKGQLKNTVAGDTGDLKDAMAKAKKAYESAKKRDDPKSSSGAFSMVFKYRYLMLLAAFSFLFTLVNTNGEFMVSKLVKDYVFGEVAKQTFANDAAKGAFIKGMFTSWYGDFYFYVNIIGVVLQSFVVSRLVKFGGLRLAFFVLPVIALFGASAVVFLPALSVLRPSKIAENATDYSVNNTVRNMLWLPTTRTMKYEAKQAVDTFFVRMGDVGSALLVLVMAGLLKLGIRAFAITNVLLIGVWLFLAAAILREQVVLKKMRESGEIPDD